MADLNPVLEMINDRIDAGATHGRGIDVHRYHASRKPGGKHGTDPGAGPHVEDFCTAAHQLRIEQGCEKCTGAS